jgi:hypothetical protein
MSKKINNMKQGLFVVAAILMLVFSNETNAQLPKTPATPNIGNLVSQFTDGMNPTSFTDKWTDGKAGFLGSAGKIAGAADFGKTITSLIGFLKPTMFKQGFNLQSLLSAAATVKTMTSAAGLLKNLEGGLKPEAFTSAWASKRSGWLSGLDLIK